MESDDEDFAPSIQPVLDLGPGAAAKEARKAAARKPEVPYTWTEAWRHACEVRYVKNLGPQARESYLGRVAEKRNAAAAQRLREDALK